MSESATVIRLLQARLERALRRRRENPSRADILVIPALALALDACGGGGSQRPTPPPPAPPPPPPPPPPPAAAVITADATGSVDENDAGATVTAVTTENATSVTVDNDHFEVADGNLKLKDDASLDFEAIDGGTLDVTITASGDGESATHTVTITVNDINEAPDAPTVRGDDLSIKENDAGATVTSLGDASDPEGDDVTFHVDNDDFEIVNGNLKLKDGVSLDHEAQDSIDLSITARDSAGNVSEATTVTVIVNDVNEGSAVTGAVANVTAEAGKSIDVEIDLTALFTDPDDGDKAIRWELSGNPSWLSLSIEYVTEDGEEKAIGHLRGTPPTTGSDSSAAHKVTLTAKDAGRRGGRAQLPRDRGRRQRPHHPRQPSGRRRQPGRRGRG